MSGGLIDLEKAREEIAARLCISDVIGRRVRLMAKGAHRYRGLCPFHGERTPSFYVDDGKGTAHCFGCGWHGDAIKFLMESEALEFIDAVKALLAEIGSEAEWLPPPDRTKSSEEAAKRKLEDIETCLGWWRQARPIQGTPIEYYLGTRGIFASSLEGGFPPTIRATRLGYWWQPETPKGQPKRKAVFMGKFWVMLAAMQLQPGLPCGMHRTYIKDDGSGKLEIFDPETGEQLDAKKMLGTMRCSSIRLSAPGETLAIGEGIETTFSARIAGLPDYGLSPGTLPAWAAGTLDNIAGYHLKAGPKHPTRPRSKLPGVEPDPERPGMLIPTTVKRIVLIRDNDGKDPESAACTYQRAINRWSSLGHVEEIIDVTPPRGSDLNDVHQGKTGA